MTTIDLSDKLSPLAKFFILLLVVSPVMMLALGMIYAFSEDGFLRLINITVFGGGLLLFLVARMKRQKLAWLLPLLILWAHYAILKMESDQSEFGIKLFFIAFFLVFIALMLGLVAVSFWEEFVRQRIIKTGLDAVAHFESFKDSGITYHSGGTVKYKYKLTMRIEGHPKSPYKIKESFYLSPDFLKKISPEKPLPIKVDRKDHKRVVLDLSEK